MANWDDLQEELNRWDSQGVQAQFWWRDDDAASASPALRRLFALAERSAVPLALAVIPAQLSHDLVQAVNESPAAITVLQHGIAHRNHAPTTQKKQELTTNAGLERVRRGLRAGTVRLERTFGSRFLAVQVPPWNRIDAAIEALLPQLGFIGLSTFGAYPGNRSSGSLPRTDCHFDLFNWKPVRSFRGQGALLAELIQILAVARAHAPSCPGPIGIMTHHRCHEESSWNFLDKLYACLTNQPSVRFLSASDAFMAAARTRTTGASGRGGG